MHHSLHCCRGLALTDAIAADHPSLLPFSELFGSTPHHAGPRVRGIASFAARTIWIRHATMGSDEPQGEAAHGKSLDPVQPSGGGETRFLGWPSQAP